MNTVLWILFILLLLIGFIYLIAITSIGIVVWCYATDPAFWNDKIKPILDDVRDWVDAGNKFADYPKERLNKFK